MPAATLVLLSLELDLPTWAIVACVRQAPPAERLRFWMFRRAWREMRGVQ